MNIIEYPRLEKFPALLLRPGADKSEERQQITAQILQTVRKEGDAALRRFSKQFDGIAPETLELNPEEKNAAIAQLSPELKTAIKQAYDNINRFHAGQKELEHRIETMPGVICWRKSVPIGKVGLYIPGGTAPLFSTVLMLGVPAQLAGCPEQILCTPSQPDGQIHPAILFAAELCGIQRIFRIGGAQAIAAMAYGTESVPPVWKIFGPGNPWVTTAKQLVSLEGVAIDLPAGPSEVCVIADGTANPEFVAADLLSQAEHGPDSQVLLISDSKQQIQAIEQCMEAQLKVLPRADVASQALQNSHALLVNHLEEALIWANAYAPEHLILAVANARDWAEKVTDAGSVFIGNYSPESAGDYASGTNHTLPTGGYARSYSGVSLDSFLKKITFQQISLSGLQQLAVTVTTMARAEGLDAHANAVDIRLKNEI